MFWKAASLARELVKAHDEIERLKDKNKRLKARIKKLTSDNKTMAAEIMHNSMQ